MTTPRRRWFAFSLRTLFVVVTVCCIAGYWLACLRHTALQRAQRHYDVVFRFWQAGMVPTADTCAASLRLFRAEAGVPLADRCQAAASHLSRITSIRDEAYGPSSEWLMGVADDAELAKAQARKAEIDHYYNEAERILLEMR